MPFEELPRQNSHGSGGGAIRRPCWHCFERRCLRRYEQRIQRKDKIEHRIQISIGLEKWMQSKQGT